MPRRCARDFASGRGLSTLSRFDAEDRKVPSTPEDLILSYPMVQENQTLCPGTLPLIATGLTIDLRDGSFHLNNHVDKHTDDGLIQYRTAIG